MLKSVDLSNPGTEPILKFPKSPEDMGLVAFQLTWRLMQRLCGIFKVISIYLFLELTGSGSDGGSMKTGGIIEKPQRIVLVVTRVCCEKFRD